MIRRIAGLAAVVALVAAAPAQAWRWGQTRAWGPTPPVAEAARARGVLLVTPSGQPVGGKWQRWADEMKVPTMSGALTFYTSSDQCGGGVPACSWGDPSANETSAWTAVGPDPAGQRDDLYFELGHQFDWHVLTWPERRYLARAWGLPHWHWRDSDHSVNLGGEDGLEAYFATIYGDCAWGINDQGSIIALFEPAGVPEPPPATPTINTCTYLKDLR